MKRFLGVNLHRTQFVVCTGMENGQQEVRQWRTEQLAEFVEQLKSQVLHRLYERINNAGEEEKPKSPWQESWSDRLRHSKKPVDLPRFPHLHPGRPPNPATTSFE